MSGFVTHGIPIIGFKRIVLTILPNFVKVGEQHTFDTSSKDLLAIRRITLGH
jgi:hypothetical protein